MILEREHAESLMGKAAQDEYILDTLLHDEDAPLEVFGFHAQQATEKMLKALLAAHGVAYPPSHRIAELIDLVKRQGISFPGHLKDISALTVFAVMYRYEFLEYDNEPPLNKSEVRELIAEFRSWAEASIKERFGAREK